MALRCSGFQSQFGKAHTASFQQRMEIGPNDRGNQFVVAAVSQNIDEHGKCVATFDFSGSDGDLELNIRRRIARQDGNPLAWAHTQFE